MARKLNTQPAPGAPPQNADADDLEILHPEREMRLWGGIVTVREYGFREGWTLQQVAAPILDRLVDATKAVDAGLEQVLDTLTDQPDLLLRLVAEACIEAPQFGATDEAKTARAARVDAFAARLQDATQTSDTDGQALLMTWWVVNGGFFVRRVVRRVAAQRAKAPQTTEASTGPTSSSPSPAPAESTSPAKLPGDTASVN